MLQSILAYSAPTFWLPSGSSSVSGDVDWLYYFVYWINVIFFLLVAFLTVFFAWKYRHREGRVIEPSAGHSTALELTWTIIPTLIVIVIFYFGFRGFLALEVDPPNSYEITVNAKMWNWSFIYPNGFVSPELHVPADTPVRFVLTSDDVLHDLFIPDWRVKKDIVPGRFNRMWVNAEKVNKNSKEPEEHDIECAEYCGTNHSAMLSKAWVHDRTEFQSWLIDASNWAGKHSYVDEGAEIYKTRGCAQCHSVTGGIVTGPTWKDMFGSQVPLSDGTTVTADDAYVRESVLYPQAKIVKGFGPVMPSYLGTMKEQDITALIAYMKSISTNYHGNELPALKQIAPKTTEGMKTAK
ncbi:MAG TPA: cytochrome c oxidase subunit II [Tepidisphaeraceae bacterium]|jgi:cytochrome c oxidase subunit 2|nr:cytochrome c oxidase subunit II [Tepidisphaeraceae bacterium]